ncbi:thiamine-monophosphate kinase [Palleronia marisminoris]|uniref:Thiamine-monophosphate kinase n=1 Tax=Palleronia marisminoris TaxID=315423 RepID=A0A1Y5TZ13_9RHOB|nr:thiamine-phosphate kinase [Palleronia marisminoris]SFH52760.1 thiamine-monophosphate kinase [Palleronia marisminoris]SLN71637.1 Thiamine-monophosphate kinase [Palleronia marisminoris]
MSLSDKPLRLSDLGEFALIRKIILPLATAADGLTSVGDDCAFIETGSDTLVVSADVGPRPLVRSLAAHHEDWEASGWLSVVATASDIASAGAKPLLLTNCIDAPADLEVQALQKFMRGYFRAMSAFGFRNGGGDLRQGPDLAARVFGVGTLAGVRRIGRDGARPGDRIAVVGAAGSFMARYLLASEAEVPDPTSTAAPTESADTLRFPMPQLRAMRLLAEHDLILAASDTSDGLLGAIGNIADASGCGFALELRDDLLSDEVRLASALPRVASPWNLFFTWGDWSVAVVVNEERVAEFGEFCAANGIEGQLLGRVTSAPGALTAELSGRSYSITPVRNENFVRRGFNSGLEGHLDYILSTPILTSMEKK